MNLKKRLGDLVTARIRSRHGQEWPTLTFRGGISARRFDTVRGTIAFENTAVEHGDFRNQRFEHWFASASTFTECEFSDAVLDGGVLGDLPVVTFASCRFERTRLRGVRPQYARFVGCTFLDADIMDWKARFAEFVDCAFIGMIERVTFSATPWGIGADRLKGIRDRNEFTGNDFSQADLRDCTFTGGIDLTANRFPRAGYAVIRDAQRQIRQAVGQLSTDEVVPDVHRVVATLKALTYGPMENQRDLFVRVEDLGRAAAYLQLDELGT